MNEKSLRITPEAEQVLTGLSADLREKVKNALREIVRDEALGAPIGAGGLRRLYKAGRFRILYCRRNGSVWIDAVSLEPSSFREAGKDRVA